MSHDQTEANLELVIDWIEALRRNDIDSLADRFHPDVTWQDVAGSIACRGREQVLAWLRASPARPHQVDALELVANHEHVVLGVHDETRQELAGVDLHGQLFTVFTLRDGQIVKLRDFAHRAEALAEAGRGDHPWR
jgi:ketosteroid isomerase-like protein